MKLVFMGTPDFAVPTFARLLEDGHTALAAYTQPPRVAGRGMSERPSRVHAFAAARGIEVRHPGSLRPEEEVQAFRALGADAAVVAAYGLILPEAILHGTRLGAFNVHASLLPRWRGAAPINRAIMAGDAETGVSIMRMEKDLDTGAVCLSSALPITPETTAGMLHDRLAMLGADLLSQALRRLEDGALECVPQPEDGITYATKLSKSETRIDFTRSAADVVRHIHGLSPSPGAWFALDIAEKPSRIKVLTAEATSGRGEPGTVIDGKLTIACGEGAVRPLTLQRAGKAALAAGDFQRGTPVPAGTCIAGA
ncbi:MAG: methionyl-tRNA formyltransferase [Parvibaculaceae bacterium]